MLQSSFLSSSVIGGRVLSVENTLSHNAYGIDAEYEIDRGIDEDTEELLLYLYERFGPVSSFTGTYRADQWTLTIRGDPSPSKFIS